MVSWLDSVAHCLSLSYFLAVVYSVKLPVGQNKVYNVKALKANKRLTTDELKSHKGSCKKSTDLEVCIVGINERVSKLCIDTDVVVSRWHLADKTPDRRVRGNVGGVDVLSELWRIVVDIQYCDVDADCLWAGSVRTRVGGDGIETVRGDELAIQPSDIWTIHSHNCFTLVKKVLMPSVLWCYRLGCTKGIQSVKTEWWGAGAVICLEHMA